MIFTSGASLPMLPALGDVGVGDLHGHGRSPRNAAKGTPAPHTGDDRMVPWPGTIVPASVTHRDSPSSSVDQVRLPPNGDTALAVEFGERIDRATAAGARAPSSRPRLIRAWSIPADVPL
jgi:hypothetical protein